MTDENLLDDGVVRRITSDRDFCAGCGVQEGPFRNFGYAWSSRQAKVRTNPESVAVLDRLLAAFKSEFLED